ncbi:hypothetical protein BU25DRAFT_413946 [Macroventuria anomochaeta]|uniref:Uncharacterized protein n=1 Tax=Macroventuria anomochaeta TaxID=301207 RepID=A0ACB6RQR0_9PLEO|nr:uncharacterized protein BU25DRAFT_413946 [Macroventuria anomochaeta]KAF2624073.1 hypothetical protein BU25DRAFT_413946 [Macroventuria anomochaeta]
MFSRFKSQEAALDTATTTPSSNRQDVPPPAYTAVALDMHSLAIGDPREQINVPMIHSSESTRLRDAFNPRRGKVTQTVIVRKMTREHYLRKYAHDANGKYVGTETAAPDAGLVFVPSKSSSDELLAQVRKVAFDREHSPYAFPIGGNEPF